MDRFSEYTRWVALFFLYAHLDERAAAQAAEKVIAKVKARFGASPGSSADIKALGEAVGEVVDASRVRGHLMNLCVAQLKRSHKALPKRSAALAVNAKRSFLPEAELSAWTLFQADATDEELSIVLFAHVLGFSEFEIASALNLSLGTVTHRLSRSIRRIGHGVKDSTKDKNSTSESQGRLQDLQGPHERRLQRRRMSSFLCQEMLYEYVRGSLDCDSRRDVDEFLAKDQASLEALEEIKRGLDYCNKLSDVHLSPSLIKRMEAAESRGVILKRSLAWSRWPRPVRWSTAVVALVPLLFWIITSLPAVDKVSKRFGARVGGSPSREGVTKNPTNVEQPNMVVLADIPAPTPQALSEASQLAEPSGSDDLAGSNEISGADETELPPEALEETRPKTPPGTPPGTSPETLAAKTAPPPSEPQLQPARPLRPPLFAMNAKGEWAEIWRPGQESPLPTVPGKKSPPSAAATPVSSAKATTEKAPPVDLSESRSGSKNEISEAMSRRARDMERDDRAFDEGVHAGQAKSSLAKSDYLSGGQLKDDQSKDNQLRDGQLKSDQERAGFVYRAFMELPDLDTVTSEIVASLAALGGEKAGDVPLGWRKASSSAEPGSYFHFVLPERNEQKALEMLRAYGPVRISKDPHPRLMPPGQIRFILWIEPLSPSGG